MLWCYGDCLLTFTHHSSRSSDHSPVKSRWEENKMRIRWEADESEVHQLNPISWGCFRSKTRSPSNWRWVEQNRHNGQNGQSSQDWVWGMFGVRVALLYHALGHLLAQRTNRNKPAVVLISIRSTNLPGQVRLREEASKGDHKAAMDVPRWDLLAEEQWEKQQEKWKMINLIISDYRIFLGCKPCGQCILRLLCRNRKIFHSSLDGCLLRVYPAFAPSTRGAASSL